tara:strand:+ start:13178 stop:14215 length:1038 start_codon:yes stop_codon:yes gene_type:complete
LFLKNTWYVAAWDHEVPYGKLVHRKILGENVVLYRKRDGSVCALEDSCPHRKLPLSMGTLVGDDVQCGYHGLKFDCSGACVEVPAYKDIPKQARVRAFPIVERWNWIWIWMGDPALADEALIIDIPEYDNPEWGINRGPAMDIACNYQHMTDNLVDPSHVSFVHKTSLGDAETVDTPVKTEVEGDSVIVSRWLMDCNLAPFFQPRVKFEGRADRLQRYELRLPSMAVIGDIIAPAGSGAPEGNLHPDVFLLDSYNFITPVDETHCRYYWFQVRNFDADSKEASDALTADFIEAFNEDIVVLEAVQKGMDNATTAPINLPIDAGGFQCKKIIKRMIAQEQAMQAAE